MFAVMEDVLETVGAVLERVLEGTAVPLCVPLWKMCSRRT